MAIKVRHNENGRVYMLLGVGFGAYKATHASVFLGNLWPTEDEAQMTMVAVCDGKGIIRWAHSNDVEVIDIDGKTPADLLA